MLITTILFSFSVENPSQEEYKAAKMKRNADDNDHFPENQWRYLAEFMDRVLFFVFLFLTIIVWIIILTRRAEYDGILNEENI